MRWAETLALPLWATAGYCNKAAVFHERLTFEGRPLEPPARRLMVQARQIATYCRTSLIGLYRTPFALDACLDRIIQLYRSPDGAPGYVFSISQDLKPVDLTRDLYTHAFVLYALAWMYRLTTSSHILKLADEILEILDRHFTQPDGSLADTAPPQDSVRRQNPQMHLLEAYLAMAEATGKECYFNRASALVSFALKRFLEPHSGLLIEEFRADWSPWRSHGQNRVEPGHLYEWAWLLREHEKLCGVDQSPVTDRFVTFASTSGCNQANGFIFDAVTETGRPLEDNFRCWPHTEAVKALYAEAVAGRPVFAAEAENHMTRLLSMFTPVNLNGGWVDRLSRDFVPAVDHMPASSLYHIIGAILYRSSAQAADCFRDQSEIEILEA